MEKLLFDMRREQYAQLRAFVIDGAKILDRAEPNWFRSINLETLNISNAFNCILGQLYRGFAEGALEISDFIPGWQPLWADNINTLARLGFTATTDGGITDTVLLTHAWKDVIEERLRDDEK